MSTGEESAVIPPGDPEIKEAHALVVSILELHGFVLTHQYDYDRLTLYAYKRHDGRHDPTAGVYVGYFQSAADRRSKKFSSKGVRVSLVDSLAVFNVDKELSGIRDEIFQELVKKYGKEKVDAKWN